MFTTSFRDTILNTLDSHFCGLITAITDWRAGTVTEAAYTGYGTRPGITFGSPANTTPAGGRQRTNSSTVSFPQNTGSPEDVIAFGVWTASTAGTLKAIGLLETADKPIFGTGATGDTITTESAHGLSADQRVFVLATPGAAIPTGLSENTAYFVRSTGLTATAFTLSTTQGGGAVDITAGGAALFIPYTAVTIATNATPEFAASALLVQI